MRVICLFFGMAVLGLGLHAGAAFALLVLKWGWLPNVITVLVALFVAYRLTLKPPLAERWKGPDWMAWAIAGAGVVAAALGPLSPMPMLKWKLGFGVSGVLEELAGLALFVLFAKLAYDTPREESSEGLAEPPTKRVFLGTWMLTLSMVVLPLLTIPLLFTDAGVGAALEAIKDLMAGKVMTGRLAWWSWASWIAAAALTWFLLERGAVLRRIPADRPGIGMITWGVTLMLLVTAPAFLAPMFEGSRLLVFMIGFVVIAGPFAVLGQALLFVGMFRLISNLEPESVEEAEPDADQPVPVHKPGATAPAPAAPAAAAVTPAKTIPEARQQLAARPHDAVLHQQLHNLLLADPAAAADLLAHARDYIAVLAKQSRADHAFTILKTCLAKDAAFRPHPDQVLPLSNLALARGEPMLALRLMHEFDRLNPGHAATAGVLYLSARVLRSQNKLAPAAKILDQLLQRFPNDPLAPQARSLREALDRLAAAPTAPPKPA